LSYNNLYRSLGSQDSNTDISQIINETKATQAKTAMMIHRRAELSYSDSVCKFRATKRAHGYALGVTFPP